MGAPEAFTATTDVGHYIDGRAVPGASGRRQPVYNPTTGAVARQVALASGGRRRRRRGRRQGRLPGLGRHAADPPRARDEQVPRSC